MLVSLGQHTWRRFVSSLARRPNSTRPLAPSFDVRLEGLAPRVHRDGNRSLDLEATNRGPDSEFTVWLCPVHGIDAAQGFGNVFLPWHHDGRARAAHIEHDRHEVIYLGAYLVVQRRFRFHLPGLKRDRWEVGESLKPIGDLEFEIRVQDVRSKVTGRWHVTVPFDPNFQDFRPLVPRWLGIETT